MKWFLTFMILLLSISNLVCAQSRAQDSLALVDLYRSTNGDRWNTNTNWLSSRPMSDWYGIRLDAQGRVIHIRLNSNSLTGSIPNLNLSNLQVLDLNFNNIGGSIPNFNLPNLAIIDLSSNNLMGSIPNFINLPNLQSLYLDFNQFMDSIPNFNLPNLEVLSLNYSQVTGSIPDFINLPRLRRLYLNHNRFRGSIPNFNLPNLEELELGLNQLDGSIPDFDLPNLYRLTLHDNGLTGNIPHFNLPNLKVLYLFNNQLTGSIPTLFQTFTRLQQIVFYNNKIDGVPDLSMLTNITSFKVDTNKLTFDDILPNIRAGFTYTKQDSIFKDTTYSKLIGQPLVIDLGIDGALPTNVYNWYKNGSFYQTTGVNQLVFNSLTSVDGGIYTCRVTNPGAPALTLYSRNATVRVTDPLRYADSLALVDLYNSTSRANWHVNRNWLSANPMNTWYGIRLDAQGRVSDIDLSRNNLRDTLPTSLNNLTKLQNLWLFFNQLSGNIPNFNLPNLYSLYLNFNQLSGSIPNLNLPQIGYLHLDNNQLTGNVPDMNTPNLKYLYFNNNQLSGKIPISFQNFSQLIRLRYYSNQIDSMPNLSMLPIRSDSGSIFGLRSQSNKLTFDDILPNIGFAASSNFIYTPQDSIFKDTTYSKNVGDALIINLGIDGALISNVYKWYKNGIFYDSTRVNQLVFNNLQTTDAGVYTCQVTNPNAPDLTLYSRAITVCVLTVVNPPAVQICQGQSYTLRNGRVVRVTGIYPDTVRCDTIYKINLTVNPTHVTNLPLLWRCNPSDTATQTQVLRNQYGCDSTVIQRFTLASKNTTHLPILSRCNPADTATQTRVLVNHYGCDSTVIQRFTLLPTNTTNLPILYRCNPNDTATQTRRLTNQYGCDSIVNQRFALATSYNRTVTNWVCSPAQVGVRTTRDTTAWGCDSIVTTRTLLARKDSLNLLFIECNIRDTGTIRKALRNQFGCDSIVIERHRLVKSDTLIQSNVICDTLFERIDTSVLKNRYNCDSLVIKHYVFDHCVCLKENKIYNGLIPNDADNQNDYFNISFVERYQPNELIITDKRGMIVYRTQNYRNSWTGTFQNGDPLPEGIYDYVFRTRHPITQKECLRMGTLTITYIP